MLTRADELYIIRVQGRGPERRYNMFRELSAEEEAPFRQWARDNYEVFSPINGTYHPVVQNECTLMNKEASQFVVEE